MNSRAKRWWWWWWWAKLSIIILTLQLHSYLITRQPLHVATERKQKKVHVVVYALVHCFYFTMSSLLHTHTLYCPHFFLLFSRILSLKLETIRLKTNFLLFFIFFPFLHVSSLTFFICHTHILISTLVNTTTNLYSITHCCYYIVEVSSSLCKFAISRYFISYLLLLFLALLRFWRWQSTPVITGTDARCTYSDRKRKEVMWKELIDVELFLFFLWWWFMNMSKDT